MTRRDTDPSSAPRPDASANARASDHADCPAFLRDQAAGMGVDVTVSTAAPVVRGPYTTEPFVCPHGQPYWMEPTSEQVAAWARDGVA